MENVLDDVCGRPSALGGSDLPITHSTAIYFLNLRPVGPAQPLVKGHPCHVTRSLSVPTGPGPCSGHQWSLLETKVTFQNSVVVDGLCIDHLNLAF